MKSSYFIKVGIDQNRFIEIFQLWNHDRKEYNSRLTLDRLKKKVGFKKTLL